ncbi:MAG: NAD(P)H-binding protein [Chloroflexi bacterium]|nr:NAD(P)H-binding protein [Chloroflexota bacterium]
MILIAGAAGAVGTALISRLRGETPTPRLRTFVRREFDALRLRDHGIEAIVGDLVTGRGVDEAMRGVSTLVYLADTRGLEGDIVTNELDAIQHALIAARAAGVRRVIAMSHVAASEDAASPYLVAHWGTELAVRQSGLEWTLLRAPMIVGLGSMLWELMRRTVDRSPVVPLFRWRHIEVEPVALRDVVEAIAMSIADGERSGQSFDITGASRMTWANVLKGWGQANERHRIYLPLPGWGESQMVGLGWSLGRLPRSETSLLVSTLRERQVCPDPSRRFPLGRRPLTYEDAIRAVRAGRPHREEPRSPQ